MSTTNHDPIVSFRDAKRARQRREKKKKSHPANVRTQNGRMMRGFNLEGVKHRRREYRFMLFGEERIAKGVKEGIGGYFEDLRLIFPISRCRIFPL